MQFESGQLLLVVFPFTDQTAAKVRPVLVVSGHTFNAGEDFVAVPLSSRSETGPHIYPISPTEKWFPQTLLKCGSGVKWTKPITISSRVVQKRLGVVPPNVLQEIQELIKTLFS